MSVNAMTTVSIDPSRLAAKLVQRQHCVLSSFVEGAGARRLPPIVIRSRILRRRRRRAGRRAALELRLALRELLRRALHDRAR